VPFSLKKAALCPWLNIRSISLVNSSSGLTLKLKSVSQSEMAASRFASSSDMVLKTVKPVAFS